jgi:ATP synthase protein I
VNLSKEPATNLLSSEVNPSDDTSNRGNGNSMQEFYHLQKTLLVITFIVTGIISLAVGFIYSLNVTLNYLLGAVVGLIYLKMLGQDVERLGQQTGISNGKRLAIFAGLIIVASKVQQLHILPVFLGFLTYKIAILIYSLQITFGENKSR